MDIKVLKTLILEKIESIGNGWTLNHVVGELPTVPVSEIYKAVNALYADGSLESIEMTGDKIVEREG